MEYDLAIDGAPETVPGGTALLLLHPSIGETDRVDTDFLSADTDQFLVVSTRTTAREVEQKLDYYDVDESKAVILDTLSIERGYSRRSAPNIHYAAGPDDIEGIVEQVEAFLESTEGHRRITLDSLSELAYYGDEAAALETAERLIELVDAHDAVCLFHLSSEVHDEDSIAAFAELFDATVRLDDDGNVSYEPRE
jgi:KaiC/GvpD/RAD55 family RecA-like ATPase